MAHKLPFHLHKPQAIIVMKSFAFAFFSFLIFTTSVKAQDAGLTISLMDSTYISVELNGTLYDDAAPVMAFHNMRAGAHQLKVLKWLQMGNSVVKQPVYDGQVNLEAGRMSDFQINRFNQLVLRSRTVVERQQQEQFMVQRPQMQMQQPMMQPMPGFNPYQPVVVQAPPPPPPIDGFTSVNTTPDQMSNSHLMNQMQMLREMRDERERLQTAKSLVSISTISSAQLAEMILLFQREQNRVRLADYGYDYVTDQQNFGVVYQTLRDPRSFRRVERRTRR
jgi:hypothetical protein